MVVGPLVLGRMLVAVVDDSYGCAAAALLLLLLLVLPPMPLILLLMLVPRLCSLLLVLLDLVPIMLPLIVLVVRVLLWCRRFCCWCYSLCVDCGWVYSLLGVFCCRSFVLCLERCRRDFFQSRIARRLFTLPIVVKENQAWKIVQRGLCFLPLPASRNLGYRLTVAPPSLSSH